MSRDRDWQDDPRYETSLAEPIVLVERGIFIGNERGREHASELGVDTIISIGTGEYPSIANVREYPFFVSDLCGQSSEEEIGHLLDETTQLITQERACDLTVFVHCVAGVSRSAAVLLDYLMTRDTLDFETALARLEQVRYCVCPNPLFQTVLRKRDAARRKQFDFTYLLFHLSQKTFAELNIGMLTFLFAVPRYDCATTLCVDDFLFLLKRKRNLCADNVKPLERIFVAFDLQRPKVYEDYLHTYFPHK